MEIFFGILGIIFFLVILSCFGWFLKAFSIVAEFGLGCLFKGIFYVICAYILIMVVVMMI